MWPFNLKLDLKNLKLKKIIDKDKHCETFG